MFFFWSISARALYAWMIEQYQDFLSPVADYDELRKKARKAFLSQASMLLRKTGRKDHLRARYLLDQIRTGISWNSPSFSQKRSSIL
jgi:hypothetical protein